MNPDMYLVDAYVKSALSGKPSSRAIIIYGDVGNGKTFLIESVAKKYNLELIEIDGNIRKVHSTISLLKRPSFRNNRKTALHIVVEGNVSEAIKDLIVLSKGHPVFIESKNIVKIGKFRIPSIEVPRPSDKEIIEMLGIEVDRATKIIISKSSSLRSAFINIKSFKDNKAGIKNIGLEKKEILGNATQITGDALLNGMDPMLVSDIDILNRRRRDVAGLSEIHDMILMSIDNKHSGIFDDKFWFHKAAYNKKHGIKKDVKTNEDTFVHKKSTVKVEQPPPGPPKQVQKRMPLDL